MLLSFKYLLALCLLGIIHEINAQSSHLNQNDFPKLSGPYLGQKTPGLTPEIFAPGIISTEKYEINSIFSNDGKEFYFAISTTTPEEKAAGKYFYIVMFSKLIDGYWTEPQRAPFSTDKYMTVDIAFSPDSKRLYFCSDRSDFSEAEGLDIWYVERSKESWSEPVNVGAPINSPAGETQPSFTDDGTMYFPSFRNGSDGVDIYSSRQVDGVYDQPVRLSSTINTQYNEGNSFISPDERYLLFARWGMPDSISGGKALFISFRNQDGTWTEAKNVEEESDMCGSLAALSPDGKYLFYSCGGDIYWVDAEILKSFDANQK